MLGFSTSSSSSGSHQSGKSIGGAQLPCRQIRLAQLKEAAKKPRYGKISSIVRNQFVREVTEASRDCWVVVLLSQERCVCCNLSCHETLPES